MKRITKLLFAVMFIASAAMYGQTLTGTVVDGDNTPLPGADVIVVGSTKGASTDFNGKFSFDVDAGSGTVTVSFIGFNDVTLAYTVGAGATTDLGTIQLTESAESLNEIVVTGVVDIAKDRQTPVAVSTIRSAEIIETLGTKEFPELLNSTPSVYATKQGGGWGDARINIRGFDQRNVAVMINGMPVNDMENGWVYWSNWAGLSDVTSAMQVQRGLGSSKLAISSVGGTINVVTRSSDRSEGGSVSTTFGNDEYQKFVGSYNTGLMDSGFSASFLFSRTTGEGYVDGTQFEGHNYFLSLGQKINDKHDLMFTFTGAPQWHHQRSWANPVSDYLKYGEDGEPDIRYNSDWGYDENGEAFSFRRNFYHKPVASLNWDWRINDNSSLSTVVYASWGRGGGTGEIGRINGSRQYSSKFKNAQGIVRVAEIQRWNRGETVADFGSDRQMFNGAYSNTGNNGHPTSQGGQGRYGGDNGISRRASMNSHNWFGSVINYNNELSETLTMDAGVDLRTYKGYHYRVVNDDLGGDNYIDYDNRNEPASGNLINPSDYVEASPDWNPFANITDQEKIDYNNDGLVNWAGVFGQLEYSNDIVSAFIQGAYSNQSFKRIEYFNEVPGDQETDWENIAGGNIKGGINWNIDEQHNVFGNLGYYSRQPNFDAVYLNFGNNLNPDIQNEKVTAFELGYGFRAEKFRLNFNAYRTSWKDRFDSASQTFDVGGVEVRGVANLYGITQVHTGLELEGSMNFGNFIVDIMGSVGNWEYDGNVTASYFDENQNPIPGADDEVLYLDGVKVGDAAQVSARIGLTWKATDNLKFRLSQQYFDNLYANIDAASFNDEDHKGSLQLPGYSLMDAGASYRFDLKNSRSIFLSFNASNLGDHKYISESDTNYHVGDRGNDATWNGINTSNRVYYGWGRTWSTSLRFVF
ncbi:TonB-dependent receptor [Urechidicola vernalis]|uniref:TonB-dependent receptor n=1 Tax=Urechidicola vernalis TaxID=3075600 RepID=A0ABU2Y5B5_9FLAO|nr:TonB-dependent receptor [Urechidicola sp. P050]MDT0553389.1 TonB-dependent receptor [Urechidicola sp. P050]